MGILDKIIGTYSTREMKRIKPIMEQVLDLEHIYSEMSDAELKSQTNILRHRYEEGASLDLLLPEAFATCREAAWRVLGMKHFPVQIIGGIVLHQGRISEMKTGEGKTLVSTLPAYLNALTGKGVHIVTVNDYLATRDSEWMGKVYNFLGLTVGLIVHDMDNDKRRAAYNCDITYGTNNELGFDYLRDNMVIYKENKVQRGFHYAIVDEVDSILIDEARTPLIISGQGDKSTELYNVADSFAKRLKVFKVTELDDKEEIDENIDADYIVDEKAKTATLTPRGVKKAEEFFHIENLMDADNMTILHHVNQAIRAYGIMHRDVDYVVKDGEAQMHDAIAGSGKDGYHITHVEPLRDFVPYINADVRTVKEGDKCPLCGETFYTRKGNELGHIFKLGHKYTKSMHVTFLAKDGKPAEPTMGCYGIGVDRTLASIIEKNNDEKGIIWPMSVAPFQVCIVPIKYNGAMKEVADTIYEKLTKAGIEVLLDDRDERPGVKFADMELIGIPLRITVGDKNLPNVEFKPRSAAEAELVPAESAAEKAIQFVKDELAKLQA